MIIFLLSFFASTTSTVDSLPIQIFDIVASYTIDQELLSSSVFISDLYKSVKSLHALSRCNKKCNKHMHSFFSKIAPELNSSFKDFFNFRINECIHRYCKIRQYVLREWETPGVEWVKFDDSNVYERYAVRKYKTLPRSMIDCLVATKSIDQPISEVYHDYIHHGYRKNNFLTNILPLQIACISSEIRDIKFLLKSKANPNKKDSQGQNALIFLCGYNDIGISQGLQKMYFIAQILLRHGTDVDIQDSYGKTALMYALQSYEVPCDYWDERGGYCQIGTPHTAYNIPLVYLLLRASNDLNLKDNEGNTVLFYALRACRSAFFINALIHKGATVNIKNNYGETPLSLARKYYKHDSKIVKDIESLTSSRFKRLSFANNNPLKHSLVGFKQLGSAIWAYSCK